jgi:hypothetical protein
MPVGDWLPAAAVTNSYLYPLADQYRCREGGKVLVVLIFTTPGLLPRHVAPSKRRLLAPLLILATYIPGLVTGKAG